MAPDPQIPVSTAVSFDDADNADGACRRSFEAVGLTASEVEQRKSVFGLNLLPGPCRVSLWWRLLSHLVHFFAVMLWTAGGLAILVGMPQLGVAIFVVILLNGLFAFVQEYRAEKAGERLHDLAPATRHGNPRAAPSNH